MNTRRKFLQQSLLGSLAVGNSDFWLNHPDLSAPLHKNAVPVVIATWAPNIKANAAAWQVLSAGGYALDAVEAGVRVPEADPNDTSVGYGGFPDRDGYVTLDACIMDEKGMAGSVTYLQDIMHAVSVARKVMENTPHVILSGDGALQFALSQGFVKENLLTEKAKKALEEWRIESKYKPIINIERHDTIGMLALDMQHRLCGACSTSGAAFKMHGRVGDSPIIGAGLFVDNEVGGAVCTGLGEMVLRTLGSFLVVEEMRRGAHPQKAVETAVKRIVKKYPKQSEEAQVAFVALDRKARHGAYSIHTGFNYALYQQGENRVIEAGSLFEK
ncbi:MAG: N(4)-(beta-N-acetylglucosaminyl)-L-asparaginase [Saprospiraceae bacterium]|jgi:N4-(beta-N-acetylglucosaminyl)-L-asparaginase|nr:N(4)-(beta-N-acetylglucosaminyl)-L-asparaginase [Saprospiraceae bacterium]